MIFSTFGIAVLIIVLLVCIYWLYKYAIKKNDPPLEKIHLKTAIEVPDSNAPVFYYSFWLYVNSWSTDNKLILRKHNDTIILFLNNNTPELICKTKSGDSAAVETTTLHKSFPLQTWVHVILSIDGTVMDYYVNGKLVTSAPLTNMLDTSESMVQLGGDYNPDYKASDIYMTGFVKKNKRATSELAKTEYNSSKSNYVEKTPEYDINLSLLKDGELTKKIKLF